MSKLEKINNLYISQLTNFNENSWKQFLTTSARNFKCNFEEQVLIFAQKPTATAVLELRNWNKFFKRRIYNNSVGIAVKETNEKLKYYFDISDTYANELSKPVPIWEMEQEHTNSILLSLKNEFKLDETINDLKSATISVANSLLDEQSAQIKEFITSSVTYAVLSRCNTLDDSFTFNTEMFNGENLESIGDKINDISKAILKNIATTINNFDKTLEISQEEEYTKHSDNTLKCESEGINNDNQIQESGRRSTTDIRGRQSGSEHRSNGETSREVHKGISPENAQGTQTDFEARAVSNRVRGTGTGNEVQSSNADGEIRGSDRTAQTDRANDMGTNDEQHRQQSNGDSQSRIDLPTTTISETKSGVEDTTDFSFTQDIIDEILVRGSRVVDGKYRIYNQFTSENDVSKNATFLSKEYGMSGGIHNTIIDNILLGSNSKGISLIHENTSTGNKYEKTLSWTNVTKRIGELISDNKYLNSEEMAYFPTYVEEEKALEKRWEFSSKLKDLFHSYNKFYSDLQSYDKCLNLYVLSDCTSCYALKRKKTHTLTMKGDNALPLMQHALENIISENTHFSETAKECLEVLNGPETSFLIPDKEPYKEYRYNENDTVYIGSDKYTISFLGDEVILQDVNFPLLTKVFERQDFDNKVSENPANEHLLIEVEEPPAFDEESTESDTSSNTQENIDIDIDKELVTFDEDDVSAKSAETSNHTKTNVPNSDPIQHTISGDIGQGTQKELYTANINAIRLLRQIESENRTATADEQQILSQYVGWGGLASYFDESKHTELKSLLSDEEYENARESMLTAYYTSPTIIKSMYQVLENVGFKKGNILEPSCGVGNFIGMLPQNMQDSKVYGVELDSISGRIAQQLYQKSDIMINGYEKTSLPDSFFDVAIGNVPFGQFKVHDKRYNKNNWLIHDYFFGATLDKVRPNGIVAFITSKGTLDKQNPAVRKYIAQRAELLGAIRLPNTAFKNAGTNVTSDIIFLQKRDSIVDVDPDWAYLGNTESGLTVNQYFIDNPHMVLGKLEEIGSQYGTEISCVPYDDKSIEELLSNAIEHISATYSDLEQTSDTSSDKKKRIIADPTVKNFSYTVVDDEVYLRENSVMTLVEKPQATINRIKGMIEIRDSVRRLIELQTENYSNTEIERQQLHLNNTYDNYTKKFGLLSSRGNSSAFAEDTSYYMLTALEHIDEDGKLERKADIFTKRTIRPYVEITSVDTSSEALAVSLSEKARVDIDFMQKLTGKSADTIKDDLYGVIFRDTSNIIGMVENPDLDDFPFVTADEFMSGNVREKLRATKAFIKAFPQYENDLRINIESLEKVQPVDLTASEIDVRLGATWLPSDVIEDFTFNLLQTSNYVGYNINVHYSELTSEWNIEGKNSDGANVRANSTYGTSRINAYKIIEETLNQKDVQIFDYFEEDGKRKQVLNREETEVAQGKQKLIRQAFKDWIWTDQQRRERLTTMYNERFNSIKPREYDGSHLVFHGMNNEIKLRPHQKNAVARTLYGGNSLFAHVVGAGKTYSMTASAIEGKRLGLWNKSMFVVPNHLIGQWATEFIQLYPSANILVATKKDFETKNRKKFCARIATGEFDAVIIGHSQFEKIPLSIERQINVLKQQEREILDGIDEIKRTNGDRFTERQYEKTKKNIQAKLEKLNDQSRKDNVVTFEELGIDKLFVDESHSYKNLYAHTKMRNVGGIAQTEAQKSSDMFMKCRYMDELTNGKGIVFATGTPVSNSMVELFTAQRYLQYDLLKSYGFTHFDAWASNFGETVTSMELSPEGTGYRIKTRFEKFYNLPELMSMFKEVADIQTSDMLNLPVPKVNYHNVSTEPSPIQKDMVKTLAKRAERVRNKSVSSDIDNMLMITNDGRKLALDQRIIDPMLSDFENSKVNACTDNLYRIWNDTHDIKGTQLVFCDLSTPNSTEFNVYDDIKNKLIQRGVPENEIKFIHEANSDTQKQELFSKVRSGNVRILFGSTQKCGAGTNVQKKLIALHDLDVPWRPSDLEQRLGRIERQGNDNAEVEVFRYVTKETFDAYSYQLIEKKQRFISQIMTSKSPMRSIDDVDATALSYAEIKMLATGNPHIAEKMNLDIEVAKLKMLKQHYLSERYSLEDNIAITYPKEIQYLNARIKDLKQDELTASENMATGEDKFTSMTIDTVTYDKKNEAGKALIDRARAQTKKEKTCIGSYRGFDLMLEYDLFKKSYIVTLKGATVHEISLGSDPNGNILRLDNALHKITDTKIAHEHTLEDIYKQVEIAKLEIQKPFAFETELAEKTKRLDELNTLLTLNNGEIEMENKLHDNSDNIAVDGHIGTWYVIDTQAFGDKTYFLLEHEEYGDEASCIIVDEDKKLILEDVWNGFSDLEENLDTIEIHSDNTTDKDLFFIDNKSELVTWLSYLPSNEEFVKREIYFDDVLVAKSNSQSIDDFFDILNDKAKTYTGEKNYPPFEKMNELWNSGEHQFDELSEATMNSLIDTVENHSVTRNKDTEFEM